MLLTFYFKWHLYVCQYFSVTTEDDIFETSAIFGENKNKHSCCGHTALHLTTEI